LRNRFNKSSSFEINHTRENPKKNHTRFSVVRPKKICVMMLRADRLRMSPASKKASPKGEERRKKRRREKLSRWGITWTHGKHQDRTEEHEARITRIWANDGPHSAIWTHDSRVFFGYI
jgi:hypothetical protein